MAPWRDALQIAADLIEQRVAADVAAARELLARTAAHAEVCPTCARHDPPFLARVAEMLGTDADLDAAAVDLAHELELTGLCGVDLKALR